MKRTGAAKRFFSLYGLLIFPILMCFSMVIAALSDGIIDDRLLAAGIMTCIAIIMCILSRKKRKVAFAIVAWIMIFVAIRNSDSSNIVLVAVPNALIFLNTLPVFRKKKGTEETADSTEEDPDMDAQIVEMYKEHDTLRELVLSELRQQIDTQEKRIAELDETISRETFAMTIVSSWARNACERRLRSAENEKEKVMNASSWLNEMITKYS